MLCYYVPRVNLALYMVINKINIRENLYNQIIKIDSAKDIFDLFKILNYPDKVLLNPSYKRKKDTFDLRKEDEDKIREIYSILTFEDKLPVFLLETTSLAPSFLRSITSTFDKQYLQFLMIVTIDYSEMIFILPDREKIDAGKQKLRLIKLVINKEDIANKKEYYSIIETLSNIYYDDEVNWRDVWKKWRKAFSVERVTEDFFRDYSSLFFTIREELNKQGLSSKEAHEFTLQLLNRIMFIYFISKKKGWLEQPKFISWLWDSYKKQGKINSNEFYDKWLRQVFFKAFNNRSNELNDLPDNIVKTLSVLPYLNGGLFRENEVDKLKVAISDSMFHKIFEFFEKYNFTIKEDMPLESEVAVDPQMLGYVYESLANVAEEIYDRNDLGIFYTPRVEVDFMCRRSLVEFLYKHLPDVPKEKFYHLIFDLPEEKDKIIAWFNKQKLLFRLKEVLDDLSVVDPACGSGAFLVGMLNVLTELYKLIHANTNGTMSDFSIKNRIIQYSLYGVDVMPWAIHAAELRLWLQLIVETEFKKEELRKNPLLPNLNLNLRVGDSLVQEVGGLTFNSLTNNLNPNLKRKLETLKQEKRKYFENSPTRLFKTVDEVKAEEIRLFEEILEERKVVLYSNIKTYTLGIKKAKSQKNLFGAYNIDENKITEYESKINGTTQELEKLKKLKIALKDPEKKPFVWDIDFAEIFGDKGGFDVVIGNPPYVPFKKISPPNVLKRDVTKGQKKEYRQKLISSVKTKFNMLESINGRSDYYIYFYFHGLSLLNSNGTLCFITSNFWLDVDYGKELQEFLCKYIPITAIYDSTKRSFAHADVNTIIALFGAPTFEKETLHVFRVISNNWPALDHVAKFVMFLKPFEEVLSTQNLMAIDKAQVIIRESDITKLVKNVIKTDSYRIFPLYQGDLLEDGWSYPDNYDYERGRFKSGNYNGNKWGGKYLRAQDIFFYLISNKKIVKLGSVCKIKTGLKESGYEDYIKPMKEVNSEKTFPILKNVKKLNKIYITQNDSYIIKSIKHFEKATVYKHSRLLWPAMRGDRHLCLFNENQFTFTGNFFGMEPINRELEKNCLLVLNSSLTFLFFEILARKGFGGGSAIMVKSDLKEHMVIFNPVFLDYERVESILAKICKREIKTIFEEIGIDPAKPIREQEPNPLPDRAELDNIIFDELRLTKDERNEVYWATCELIKQRLEKAKSFKGS